MSITSGHTEAMRTHEALMQAIADNRDKAAFRTLFAHFAPRIKTFLMQSGIGQERAEDLVQETMVVVWRKAATYRADKAAVSTWMFQIARNKLIDHLRRHKYPEIDFDEHAADLEAAEDAETPALVGQIGTRVSRAVRGLTQPQREVIELSFYEELSHSQIAERLALPLGTVKSRIRMAFDLLRKELGTLE